MSNQSMQPFFWTNRLVRQLANVLQGRLPHYAIQFFEGRWLHPYIRFERNGQIYARLGPWGLRLEENCPNDLSTQIISTIPEDIREFMQRLIPGWPM